eukprot:1422337-Alexandrium_andersonii.AAC.1
MPPSPIAHAAPPPWWLPLSGLLLRGSRSVKNLPPPGPLGLLITCKWIAGIWCSAMLPVLEL